MPCCYGRQGTLRVSVLDPFFFAADGRNIFSNAHPRMNKNRSWLTNIACVCWMRACHLLQLLVTDRDAFVVSVTVVVCSTSSILLVDGLHERPRKILLWVQCLSSPDDRDRGCLKTAPGECEFGMNGNKMTANSASLHI
jgi:hypothetical protein